MIILITICMINIIIMSIYIINILHLDKSVHIKFANTWPDSNRVGREGIRVVEHNIVFSVC